MLPLLVAFILWVPVWGFFCLSAGIVAWALYEYYAMAFARRRPVESWLATLAGTLLMGALAVQSLSFFVGGLTFAIFVFACLFLVRFGKMDTVAAELSLLCFGFLYITIPMAHLVLLRSLTHGTRWVLLVLFMVMLNDTCAYFTGTFLGRRKFYPDVSPNKSIEGAVGGLGGSVLAAALAHFSFLPWTGAMEILFLGLIVGIVAELGDLFESLLKRSFGVKDSGCLIPGHGGILDRLDSLIFAFPLTYYFALYYQG